jgi:hypothetical protein
VRQSSYPQRDLLLEELQHGLSARNGNRAAGLDTEVSNCPVLDNHRETLGALAEAEARKVESETGLLGKVAGCVSEEGLWDRNRDVSEGSS